MHWSETNNVKWRTAIPFRGWSTPVVLGGQVWLTTATEDGHDFFALGLDAETGEIRFNEALFHHDNPEPLGNGASMNCYATPSPVIEPGRVCVHFGKFGTACLDTKTGKVLWKRDDLPCRHYRGPASSLVSFENLVILTMDGVDLQYHVALDKQTGQTVWTERVGGKHAASPIYADGRLYFLSQDGTTKVLKPGRALEVMATNTLASGCMASPAVSGKAFYLRTKTHLYRTESSKRATTAGSRLAAPSDTRPCRTTSGIKAWRQRGLGRHHGHARQPERILLEQQRGQRPPEGRS